MSERKILVQGSLVEAVDRYEKQEKERKSRFLFRKLDALRAFTRASYYSNKSYFTKMRIGHNKSKLKNQDILAQEFSLDIYYSSCFVEYPPHPIASCEFKPFWFKNEAQLPTH